MPMASTRPNNVRLFRLEPHQDHDAKVPTSDTATSITGRSRAFQSCKNSKMTMATRMTASRSVWNTSFTDSRMNGVVS